jgi:tetratricopeptide (TPR) repeat protein
MENIETNAPDRKPGLGSIPQEMDGRKVTSRSIATKRSSEILSFLGREWVTVGQVVGLAVLIAIGWVAYGLSPLYYVHELAHLQTEHRASDEQQRANEAAADYYVNLGNLLFSAGETKEAARDFAQAQKFNPGNLAAQAGTTKTTLFDSIDANEGHLDASPLVVEQRLAALEDSIKVVNGAEHVPRDVWPSDEEHAHWLLLRGMSIEEADPKGSLEALSEAISLVDVTGVNTALGGAQKAIETVLGARAQDQTLLSQLLKASEANNPHTKLPAAYVQMGDVYLNSPESLSLARGAYLTALAAMPLDINTLDSLGYSYYLAKDLANAMDVFQRLEDLDQNLLVSYADLSRTERLKGLSGPPADRASLLTDAEHDQERLLSVLTSKTPMSTRDTKSQWQYPLKDRYCDLHESAAKAAYAMCTLMLTRSIVRATTMVGACQRAIVKTSLTITQRRDVTEFMRTEVDDLLQTVDETSERGGIRMAHVLREFRSGLRNDLFDDWRKGPETILSRDATACVAPATTSNM